MLSAEKVFGTIPKAGANGSPDTESQQIVVSLWFVSPIAKIKWQKYRQKNANWPLIDSKGILSSFAFNDASSRQIFTEFNKSFGDCSAQLEV